VLTGDPEERLLFRPAGNSSNLHAGRQAAIRCRQPVAVLFFLSRSGRSYDHRNLIHAIRKPTLVPKVLLINNYHYRRGGAEVVYLEQARMLRQRGWQVVEFAMQHPDNDPSAFSADFAEEIEYGRQRSLLTTARHAVSIVYSREAAQRVTSLIHRERPELVHAHNIYHHLSPSVLSAASKCGLPVFLTAHDLKLLCPSIYMRSKGKLCEDCRTEGRVSVIRKRCQKDSLALSTLVYLESSLHDLTGIYRRSVTRMISPSRFLIDKFAEWRWDGPEFSHVPNFVDHETVRSSSPRGNHFVYFGRLSTEKGVDTLLEAAIRAKVELRLIGSGPVESALRKRVEASGAQVRFLGHLTGPSLWENVGGARAAVLPSECYENAPLSILEAYACAVPVIGARIGGIPELVLEGETGSLFESGNVDSLTDELGRYAAMSPAHIDGMGQRAREWVTQRFTPERHIESLIDAYRGAGVRVPTAEPPPLKLIEGHVRKPPPGRPDDRQPEAAIDSAVRLRG
jgi:glycosyltransferase involved in cell wall biosynthesis